MHLPVAVDLDRNAGDFLFVDGQRHEPPAFIGEVFQHGARVRSLPVFLDVNLMEVVIAAVAGDDKRRRAVLGDGLFDALQDDRAARPATATKALRAMTSRHGDQQPDGPWRTPTDQTSRPESPANAPNRSRRNRLGTPSRPAYRSPRKSRSENQTTDESRRAVPETRSRGCSQASLYNEERPHSAIGNKTPIELVNRSVALGPP